ncbi:MAG: type II secretion system F family protein [Candidatus Sumerlaeota bacterium]|nr:type II secretion system F family protein [Candidatus Sumerlaeota bacterium]
MMEFQYRALNTEGAVSEGVLSAGSRKEAIRKLEIMGLDPVHVAERTIVEKTESHALPVLLRRKKLSSSDLESFTRQLSSLLAAGVPLSRALNIIQRETSSPAAREKWKEIHDLVIDGSSLAEALRRSSGSFPGVYVAMVQAGETGGFLDLVLGQIADFQSRERDLKSRTVSALIYPIVLVVLATSVLTFLLTFFIPRFKLIFEGFGAKLPLPTRIIVGVSGILTHYGPFVAIIVAVSILLVKKWFQSEHGRRLWHMCGSVLEMIAVSEESGRLDKELLRIAQETEQELDRRLRTAVALLEPLMLFIMAGFIGTIFISMVIPIFTLQEYIK